jgi:hypothetical protein
MSGAHEVSRQHMKEEAADELLGPQSHDSIATASGIVLVAEPHAEFVHGQKPIIGECDAVRVAAQILKHLCRTCHRALGIHDPGLHAQFIEQRVPVP